MNKISLRSLLRILCDKTPNYGHIKIRSSESDPTMLWIDIEGGNGSGTGFYDMIKKKLFTISPPWIEAIKDKRKAANFNKERKD